MKSWIHEIEQHIDHWSNRLRDREWWPKFVYHFTDVHNAARILTDGQICSRAEAEKRKIVFADAASQSVIAHTRIEHTEYARLYFRPLTPTQYRNEGIRPSSHRWNAAHCPMPVFFCFHTKYLLGLDSTKFSNGNMGSGHVQHGDSLEFFKSIPFEYVFHNSWFSADQRDTITFHRHAEVLVPRALDIVPGLAMVVCRSPAERTTLLHMLTDPVRMRWGNHIRLGYEQLFHRRWTYVESVRAVNGTVVFSFNPDTETPGPFQAQFEYIEHGRTARQVWSGTIDDTSKAWAIRVSTPKHGVAKLLLDGCLAFHGDITFDDAPF